MRKYCRDKTKIENYELAKADDFKGWQLHHRLESHFSDGTPRPKNAFLSADELKDLDLYWERPPEELIYMRTYDHRTLHSDGAANPFYGKTHTEEVRKRIADALTGKPGHKHTEETKRQISNSHKGKKHTAEARKKMSDKQKNYHWFNNGIICVRCVECPEGFKPGRFFK